MLMLKAYGNSKCWLVCADAQAGQYLITFCHFSDDIRHRYSYEVPYNIMDSDVHVRIQRALSEWVEINSDNVYLNYYFCFFYLVDDGRERVTTKTGHHRSASETPFQWRFAGGPMMTQH